MPRFKRSLPRYANMLELHSERVLFRVFNYNPDDWSEAVWEAAKQFKKETGCTIFMMGRSARHICILDTRDNAKNYGWLRRKALRMAKELEDRFNAQAVEKDHKDAEPEFEFVSAHLH